MSRMVKCPLPAEMEIVSEEVVKVPEICRRPGEGGGWVVRIRWRAGGIEDVVTAFSSSGERAQAKAEGSAWMTLLFAARARAEE